MQNTQRLEDVAFASGAMRQVRLQGLAKGKRIRRLSLYFDLSGTKDAADALDGDLFARIVSQIRLNSSEHQPYNLTGFDLWRLQHLERGRVVADPTDIPGTGTTFVMQFQLDLSFRVERQQAPDDGSLSTSLFTDQTLEITFAAANTWGVGNLLVTAGNVRVAAEYAEGDCVPQLVENKYIDLSSGLATLEPGIILGAMLVQTDYSTITTAELTLLGLTADGKEVHPSNTMHEQLVTMWNQDAAEQSGTPHELDINAARFIPLVWQPRRLGFLTKQPAIEKQGEVRVTAGTLTTPRLLVKIVKLKTDQQAANIAVKAGAPSDSTVYEPAVGSKSAVRAVHETARRGGEPTKKARLLYAALPGKMRQTKTPGNI
ncbi:MAG: hypothetical protein M0R37_13725 [Bacteroidales bacterium]|jgi:hypothetical protein|nr:hypothetical protein [Bacteroidales bacterium]